MICRWSFVFGAGFVCSIIVAGEVSTSKVGPRIVLGGFRLDLDFNEDFIGSTIVLPFISVFF